MNEEHILLSLCGTSPAVITETIWALAQEHIENPSSADLPHRIVVLTTTLGAKSIREQLLTCPQSGTESIWSQLRNELKQAGFNIKGRLVFGDTSEHLRVFSIPCPLTGLASPLDDIRTADDQTATADYLLETLRSFTETPNTKVTASLAGGRKTMSSLLYGCMTLIGRRDDRLTHVLVSQPYDSPVIRPRFYYPQQQEQELITPNELHPILAQDAQVQLMDVPYVPVRYAFEKQLGDTPGGFHELVAIYTGKAILTDVDLPLSLNPIRSEVQYGTYTIKLSLREFGLMHFLAFRAQQKLIAYPDYKSGIDDYNAHLKTLKDNAPQGNIAHPYHRLQASEDHSDIRKILNLIKDKIKQCSPGCSPLARCLPERGRLSLEYPAKLITLNP